MLQVELDLVEESPRVLIWRENLDRQIRGAAQVEFVREMLVRHVRQIRYVCPLLPRRAEDAAEFREAPANLRSRKVLKEHSREKNLDRSMVTVRHRFLHDLPARVFAG